MNSATSIVEALFSCIPDMCCVFPAHSSLRGAYATKQSTLPSSNSGLLHLRSQRRLGRSLAQGLFRITGDLLVALRQGREFVAADDVVDRGERGIVGALTYLAQDRIRRIGAVGQDDARGRLQSLLFVSFQRGHDIAVLDQRRSQRPRIENSLSSAVGTARHHRMRRVAEQRYATKAPARQRVLI